MKFDLTLSLKQRQVLPCVVLPVYVSCGPNVHEMIAFTASDLYTQVGNRLRKKKNTRGLVSLFQVNDLPFTITYRGRLLPNRPIGLTEYGICSKETLILHIGGLRGGFNPLYPDQIQKSRKCEPVEDLQNLPSNDLQRYQKVLNKLNKRKAANECEIQSIPTDIYQTFKKAIETIKGSLDSEYARIIEDVLICALQLYKSKDAIDVSLAIMSFVKVRSGRSMSSVYAQLCSSIISKTFNVESIFDDANIDTYPLQSSEGTESLLESFREYMNNWDDAKESELGRKYTNLFKNLMSLGMLEWIGLKPTRRIIYGVREVNNNWIDYANLIHCVVDTASLTLLRAIQAQKTGTFESFIHGPKSYQQWYDLCCEVKKLAPYTGNLEALGTDYFSFVTKLDQCIEQGQAICKFTLKENKSELRSARTMLNDMHMLKADVLCVKSAQQERRAPFALLIHGGSSIAKSAFTKAMFYYYGKLMGMPCGDEYKYPRNSKDERWDNYRSSMWCIVMDDIAYLDPTKASMDESLIELIQIINNVPLVPQQAHLDDKGKTPVRVKLVLATTNTKDLNAFQYFACPLAVQRRLPWVVTLKPKPCYAKKDSPNMIDPEKLPVVNNEFPDFWHILVEKVVANGTTGRKQTAAFEKVASFDNIYDYFDWLGPVIKSFEAIQCKAMKDDQSMKDMKFCHEHNRPISVCGCDIQSGIQVLLPQGTPWGENWTVTNDTEILHYHYRKLDDTYYLNIQTLVDSTIVTSKTVKCNVVKKLDIQSDIFGCDDSIIYSSLIDETIQRRLKDEPNVINAACVKLTGYFIKLYVNNATFRGIANWCTQLRIIKWLVRQFVLNWFQPDNMNSTLLKFAGMFIDNDLFSPRKLLIATLAGIAAIVAGITLFKGLVDKKEPLPVKPVKEDIGKTSKYWSDYYAQEAKAWAEYDAAEKELENKRSVPLPTQGNMMVTADYFKKDEKENVWKKESYETTTFDIEPISHNYAQLPRNKITTMLRRNIARIAIRHQGKVHVGHMFCVGGHLWVSNNHIFPMGGDLTVDVIFEKRSQGASLNMTILVEQCRLFRQPNEDLVWLEVLNIEPKKDYSQLLCKSSLQGTHRTVTLATDTSSVPVDILGYNISRVMLECDTLKNRALVWTGRCSQPTYNGYCGSIMLAVSPTVVILGLHQRYCDYTIVSTRLCVDDFNKARTFFVRPLIQSAAPLLSAPGYEKSLMPLHHNAHIRYMTEGHVSVYGSIPSTTVQPRSKVTRTFIADKVNTDRGWSTECVAPNLRDWRMWNLGLKDVVTQKHLLKESILKECVAAFSNEILQSLTEDSLSQIRILDDHSAINGVQGVRFLDAINMNTSMGYPWCHSKKFHMHHDPTECLPDAKMYDEEIMERFHAMEAQCRQGVRASPVYNWSPKDEARASKKVDLGMIRLFNCSPAEHALLMRKYLLTFVKVFQEHPRIFEGAPGCVAQSLEWEQHREYLTQFGKDRMVCGDYKAFDKNMEATLIHHSFDVIKNICKAAGWKEDDLIVIDCIANDLAHNYCVVDGQLLQISGSNPSGHPLTVIINCIANAIYMRYTFRTIAEKILGNEAARAYLGVYKKHVALLTYGDDNVLNVTKEFDWYNHTSIAKELADIGVTYTMADKTSASIPFIHIDDVSFLKRTWRWDADVNAYLAPLEEASLHKSLLVNIPSKSISKENQIVSVMNSSVNEFFFYGKQRFESERLYFLGLIKHFNLEHEYEMQPFPTWEMLYARFWKSSKDVVIKRKVSVV